MEHHLVSRRLLACPPRYYDLKPLKQEGFQMRNRSVNRQLARQQWINLIRILGTNGYQIEIIPPQKNNLVQTFCSEIGFQIDGCLIFAQHLEDGRDNEVYYHKNYFKSLGYQTIEMPYFFSGSIDMVTSHGGKQLWIGYDGRTSLQGAHYLSQLLEKDNLAIKYLRLVNPKFFHLSMCLCPFGEGYALVFPEAFDSRSYAMLLSSFGQDQLMTLKQDEAESLVCNSLMIHDISGKTKGLFIASQISPRLKKIFHQLGYGYREVALTEFLIRGSSVKSLFLEL